MAYDSRTASEARGLVEKFREAAVKERNKFNKLNREEIVFQPSALSGQSDKSGYIKARYMYYIWFEVEKQLKLCSNKLAEELQPTESNVKIQEYAEKERRLDELMKTEFGEVYDEAIKAGLDAPELAIFLLGQVLDDKSKKKDKSK